MKTVWTALVTTSNKCKFICNSNDTMTYVKPNVLLLTFKFNKNY